MATGILGTADLAAGTWTNLYPVPATTFSVVSLSLVNRSNQAVLVRVACTTATTAPPSAPLNSEFIEYDVEILAKGVLERTGIVMDAGKILAVYTGSYGVSAVAFGIETSTV
jgi:hypothetical protein